MVALVEKGTVKICYGLIAENEEKVLLIAYSLDELIELIILTGSKKDLGACILEIGEAAGCEYEIVEVDVVRRSV